MTVNKYTGKTKEEAIAAAKEAMGPSVVIMHVKEEKKGGFLGMFKNVSYEVTAGLEDDLVSTSPKSAAVDPVPLKTNRFDAVADEQIDLNLKDAFDEINAVLKKSEATPVRPQPSPLPSEVKRAPAAKEPERLVNNTTQPVFTSQPVSAPSKPAEMPKASRQNNIKFVKMLYNTLLDNEVDEKYINQILDEMSKVFQNGSNIDFLISNVYQKMVLMLEEPKTITCDSDGLNVVFFIGPTGVGKTTTIAKVASEYVLKKKKKVALLTADTYRLAATDQLREYANILDIPMSIVLTPDDINSALAGFKGYDLVLVDTAGFSHKNQAQREDMNKILQTVDPSYNKDVYLVLSATTKYKDLLEIIDIYKSFTDFNIIFTKLDETSAYGSILNCKLYSGAKLSYVTNGQNVPDDIEVLDTQKIVKNLLGGN